MNKIRDFMPFKFKHKFKMFNKKGAIGEGISIGITSIFIVLIVIVFVLISSFIGGGISKDLTDYSNNLIKKQEAEISLQAYLKTPVEIDRNNIQQNITIADLIRLSQIDKAYEGLLKTESKKIFDKIYGDYSLHVNLINIKSTDESIGIAAMKIATINIPLNINENIPVRIMIK